MADPFGRDNPLMQQMMQQGFNPGMSPVAAAPPVGAIDPFAGDPNAVAATVNPSQQFGSPNRPSPFAEHLIGRLGGPDQLGTPEEEAARGVGEFTADPEGSSAMEFLRNFREQTAPQVDEGTPFSRFADYVGQLQIHIDPKTGGLTVKGQAAAAKLAEARQRRATEARRSNDILKIRAANAELTAMNKALDQALGGDMQVHKDAGTQEYLKSQQQPQRSVGTAEGLAVQPVQPLPFERMLQRGY